jgi:hypothetical protein
MKQMFPGLKNSQKIRFVVNGFAMVSTIKDIVFNVQSTYHSAAIADAIQKLTHIRSGSGAAERATTGIVCTAFNGCSVQVDLV